MKEYKGYLTSINTYWGTTLPQFNIVLESNYTKTNLVLEPGIKITISAPQTSKGTEFLCGDLEFHKNNDIIFFKKSIEIKECPLCQNINFCLKCKFGADHLNWPICGSKQCPTHSQKVEETWKIYFAAFRKFRTPLKIGISRDPESRIIAGGYSYLIRPQLRNNHRILYQLPVATFVEWLIPRLYRKQNYNPFSDPEITTNFSNQYFKYFTDIMLENTPHNPHQSNDISQLQNRINRLWKIIGKRLRTASQFENPDIFWRYIGELTGQQELVNKIKQSELFSIHYNEIINLLYDLSSPSWKITPLSYEDNLIESFNPDHEVTIEQNNSNYFSLRKKVAFENVKIIASRGPITLFQDENDSYYRIYWKKAGFGRYVNIKIGDT